MRLVKVLVQGKHRYYSLAGPDVASALEGLSVLAGGTPALSPIRQADCVQARTCYDHMAGTVAVSLHDRFYGAGTGFQRVQRAAISIRPHAGWSEGVRGSGHRHRCQLRCTASPVRLRMPGLERAAASYWWCARGGTPEGRV